MKRTLLARAIASAVNPEKEGSPRMKIKFSTVLLALDGTSLKKQDAKGTDLGIMTLAHASTEALLAYSEDSGTAKFEAYEIARKIKEAGDGELEITPEDAGKIKDKIARIYSPAVVGPAFVLLNG